MKFQTLVSTMNQTDYELIKRMKLTGDAVVINQCGRDENSTVIMTEAAKVMWLDSTEYGLSKSRNKAIMNSVADICVLADDDEEFVLDYEKKIIEEFEKHPFADIIAFQVNGIEKKFKEYSPKEKRLSFFSSFKVSSVQVAFRRIKLLEKGICFNERFGAGAEYIMGEENILLCDALRNDLTLYYVPTEIAKVHIGQSTWNTGFTERYFISRGAQFFMMSHQLYFMLIIYFAFHIYSRYKSDFSFFDAIRLMRKGAKEMKYRGKKNE